MLSVDQDLFPTGSELFSDAEDLLTDLSEALMEDVNGAGPPVTPWILYSIAEPVVKDASVGLVGLGVGAASAALKIWKDKQE
jgi:hypothetical protein